jgi:hypothetical protein
MSAKALQPEDSLLLGVLLRTAICIYLFAFFDAFRSAAEISSGRDRVLPYNPRVAAVLNLTTRGFGYFYLGERKLGFIVFFGLLVVMQITRAAGIPALDVLLEIVLVGMAVHAYRMATRLNPAEESLPPVNDELRHSRLTPVVFAFAGVIVLAYAGLTVLGSVASAFVPNYGRIDQTQSNLNVEGNTTTYTNRKYGVRLRLEGLWVPEKSDTVAFCFLTNREKFVQVLFVAEGVWPMTRLESYSKKVIGQFIAQTGAKIEEERALKVGGLEGRRLTFRVQHGGFEIRQGLLLAKKDATVYGVWVNAPAFMDENWTKVMESIPGAITIQ